MSEEGGTVSVGDFEVTTNYSSPEELRASFGVDEKGEKLPEDQPSEEEKAAEAARVLGKKGGEAAAAKRAEAKAAEAETEEEPPAAEPEKPTPQELAERRRGNPRYDAKAKVQLEIRERKAAEERAARAEAELERMRAERATPKAEPKRAPDDDPEPVDTDPAYEGKYDKYLEDRSRWAARDEFRQQSRKAQAQAQAEAMRQHFQVRATNFEKAYETALKEDPELDEKLGDFGDVVPTSVFVALHPGQTPKLENHLAEEVFSDAENAHRWLLYFSGHPEEFGRLANLPNGRALLREMGRIEERWDAASTATAPKPKSQAKPPVRPVTGTPFADEEEDLGQIEDLDTYVSKRPKSWKRQ